MVKLYPPGMFRGGLQDLHDGHVRDPGNGSEVFLEVVAKIDNQDYLGFFFMGPLDSLFWDPPTILKLTVFGRKINLKMFLYDVQNKF